MASGEDILAGLGAGIDNLYLASLELVNSSLSGNRITDGGEWVLGAGAIILFQIPVNRLTRNVPTHQAILIGFAVSSLIWIIIGIHPSVPTIAAGIATKHPVKDKFLIVRMYKQGGDTRRERSQRRVLVAVGQGKSRQTGGGQDQQQRQ